jgi:hypothetical protein
LLQDHWAFQSRKTIDPLDRTTVYKGRITQIVTTISILPAAVLLAVAIISLYIVNDPTTKLGLVVAYIALLTNAVVLVVFISGNLGAVPA